MECGWLGVCWGGSYKLYGSPAITEEGGSLLRMLRTVGIPSIQLNTTLHNWERINKTFFEASLKCFYLAASPLPSLANIYFKTFMNKIQIEEKQCRKEHDRCIGDNACNWQHFSISAAIWFSTGLSRNTVHSLLQPVNHCDCPLGFRSRSSFLL